MTAFVLIHGATDVGWYWHRVEQELRARGHQTTAPDLPCEDDGAGLAEYADTVIGAAGSLRAAIWSWWLSRLAASPRHWPPPSCEPA